jgi:hypothetical protein
MRSPYDGLQLCNARLHDTLATVPRYGHGRMGSGCSAPPAGGSRPRNRATLTRRGTPDAPPPAPRLAPRPPPLAVFAACTCHVRAMQAARMSWHARPCLWLQDEITKVAGGSALIEARHAGWQLAARCAARGLEVLRLRHGFEERLRIGMNGLSDSQESVVHACKACCERAFCLLAAAYCSKLSRKGLTCVPQSASAAGTQACFASAVPFSRCLATECRRFRRSAPARTPAAAAAAPRAPRAPTAPAQATPGSHATLPKQRGPAATHHGQRNVNMHVHRVGSAAPQAQRAPAQRSGGAEAPGGARTISS